MAPLTGNDIADMLQTCDQHDISYLTAEWLTTSYALDLDARVVYLNGQLPVDRFFHALRVALVRLVRYLTAGTVIPLRLGRLDASTG